MLPGRAPKGPALIFGGNGFFGRPLASALLARGMVVHAASRRGPGDEPSPAPDGNLVRHRCDAADPGAVARLVASVRPSVVYNLTSDSRGGREIDLIPGSLRNDLVAGVNILMAAERVGVDRVVVTGSMEEPHGDAGSTVPSSPYAAAKWAGAAYARMMAVLHDLPVTILRPMMTYGPGQKTYKLLPSVAAALVEGRPVPVSSGRRLVDWVYIDDVVAALVAAGERPPLGAFAVDIGTGVLISTRACLTLLGDLTGRPDLIRFGALPDRALEVERAADTGPARDRLGWQAATPLNHGLERMLDAARANRTRGPDELRPRGAFVELVTQQFQQGPE